MFAGSGRVLFRIFCNFFKKNSLYCCIFRNFAVNLHRKSPEGHTHLLQ